MAALLVGLAVMAVMLSVAMPTWSHMIRRDKEEELIFRGNQYARAIRQYEAKFAPASPPDLDVLIKERMLRKKFRDPLSTEKNGEFQMLYLSNQAGTSPGGVFGQISGGGTRGGTTPSRGGTGQTPGLGSGSVAGAGAGAGETKQSTSAYSTKPSGGIVGVTSKNKGQSIRMYKGKNHYNEWEFIGRDAEADGAGGGRGGGGGDRGGRGGREGGGRQGGFGGSDGRGGSGSGGFRGRGDQGGFGGRGDQGGFGGRGDGGFGGGGAGTLPPR